MRTDLKTLYAADAEAWRDWLADNSETERSIWLVIHHRNSATQSVSYEDAIEHALCFGWVDSTTVKRDGESRLQQFTPRNPRSTWAPSNRARAQKLIDAGLMRPAGQALIDAAKQTGRWDVLADGVPDELRQALDTDEVARGHFEAFAPSSKRRIVEWIVTAKRPETRRRRIARTIELAHDNVPANHPARR